MNDGTERRQAKRIAIRLPVVYRGPDGTPVRGTTENVSRRGMLIVAKAAPHGTTLRVAVTGADHLRRAKKHEAFFEVCEAQEAFGGSHHGV